MEPRSKNGLQVVSYYSKCKIFKIIRVLNQKLPNKNNSGILVSTDRLACLSLFIFPVL